MTGRQKYMPDIVLQNDIAETVRENIKDLAVLEEKFPDTDILVFDREGFCIYPEGENVNLRANGIALKGWRLQGMEVHILGK